MIGKVGVHGIVGIAVSGREESREMLTHWVKASMVEKGVRKEEAKARGYSREIVTTVVSPDTRLDFVPTRRPRVKERVTSKVIVGHVASQAIRLGSVRRKARAKATKVRG